MAVSMSKTSILKVLELVLVIVCLGLQYHSFAKNDDHEVLITCGTFGGYLIILIAALMGSCTGQPINKRVDIFFSIVGAALFIAAGILSIRYFQNWVFDKDQSDIGTAKGAIAIVNGALFILDAFFSFRGE